MPYCQECGFATQAGAKFCPNCGAPTLATAGLGGTAEGRRAQVRNPRPRMTIMLSLSHVVAGALAISIGGILVLVGISGFGSVFGLGLLAIGAFSAVTIYSLLKVKTWVRTASVVTGLGYIALGAILVIPTDPFLKLLGIMSFVLALTTIWYPRRRAAQPRPA